MSLKLLREIDVLFNIAIGKTVQVHSIVGSTLVTRTDTKRELKSSSDPFMLYDVPNTELLLSLLSTR